MNNRVTKQPRRAPLTLGDLVLTICEEARNRREAAAAISDLFRRGRVRLRDGRSKVRFTV
jgi:hypothetical protein